MTGTRLSLITTSSPSVTVFDWEVVMVGISPRGESLFPVTCCRFGHNGSLTEALKAESSRVPGSQPWGTRTFPWITRSTMVGTLGTHRLPPPWIPLGSPTIVPYVPVASQEAGTFVPLGRRTRWCEGGATCRGEGVLRTQRCNLSLSLTCRWVPTVGATRHHCHPRSPRPWVPMGRLLEVRRP